MKLSLKLHIVLLKPKYKTKCVTQKTLDTVSYVTNEQLNERKCEQKQFSHVFKKSTCFLNIYIYIYIYIYILKYITNTFLLKNHSGFYLIVYILAWSDGNTYRAKLKPELLPINYLFYSFLASYWRPETIFTVQSVSINKKVFRQ